MSTLEYGISQPLFDGYCAFQSHLVAVELACLSGVPRGGNVFGQWTFPIDSIWQGTPLTPTINPRPGPCELSCSSCSEVLCLRSKSLQASILQVCFCLAVGWWADWLVGGRFCTEKKSHKQPPFWGPILTQPHFGFRWEALRIRGSRRRRPHWRRRLKPSTARRLKSSWRSTRGPKRLESRIFFSTAIGLDL